MNKSKKTANIYFSASGLWYMNASTGLGTMWLCIGSVNYCIGYKWLKRSKNMNRQDKDDNKNE